MLVSHPSNRVTDTGGKYAKDSWICLSGLVWLKGYITGEQKTPCLLLSRWPTQRDFCTSLSLPKRGLKTQYKIPFIYQVRKQARCNGNLCFSTSTNTNTDRHLKGMCAHGPDVHECTESQQPAYWKHTYKPREEWDTKVKMTSQKANYLTTQISQSMV